MRAEPLQRVARRMRPLLGTFVEVVCVDTPGTASQDNLDAAFHRAFAALEAVERCLSFQNPASELSRLNRSAGGFVTLSPLSIRVLRASRALSLASGGLFNHTIGGALVRSGALPNPDRRDALDCGDVRDVEIEGCQARLRRPVLVTLDGMAKGFAIDQGVRALRARGVRAGWINAGGDIRAFGPVAVPVTRRELDGSMRALGSLSAASLATSVVRDATDGDFPGEIHAPDGTCPNRGAWTIIAHSAWKADALTKVAALASAEQRGAIIGRLGGALVAPNPVH